MKTTLVSLAAVAILVGCAASRRSDFCTEPSPTFESCFLEAAAVEDSTGKKLFSFGDFIYEVQTCKDEGDMERLTKKAVCK